MQSATRLDVNPVRVLITDDNARFRRALRMSLDRRPGIEVVADARDGAEALEVLARTAVDVALIDLRMPGMDGCQLTGQIRQRHPGVAAMALTVSDDDGDLLEMLRCGARGYMLKTATPSEITRGVFAVAAGDAWLSPPMAAKLIADFTALPAARGLIDEVALTPREDAVLRQLALGRTNKEIAVQLHIAETTVKSHLKSILEKLHVRNRVEAVLCALQRYDRPMP